MSIYKLIYDLDLYAMRIIDVLPILEHWNHTMQEKIMSWKLNFLVAYKQSLSLVCDLRHWASDVIFVANTSSCHNNQSCQFIYKCQYKCLSYRQTQTGFSEIYAQHLSADCDIDLCHNNMVFAHDTLFGHADHLYLNNFKSHHA